MATSIAVQQQGNSPSVQSSKDIRALILSETFQEQIKKAMPEKMSSDILLRVAVTTIQKTPKLMECSQTSLLQCVLECAQLGLLPDGILGQAYLVPYNKAATLQIGYRGLLELARRSGQFKYIVAEAVYSCDTFKIEYAPQRSILHVPDIDNEQRGEAVKGKYLPAGFRGVYAMAIYKDGGIDFEYLPLHKVERIRASSQSGNQGGGPWLNHFEEMARKTAIRSLAKRLPLSADDLRFVVKDEYRDAGIDVDYAVDAGVKQVVEDVEIDGLMRRLGWNEAKMSMSRRNFQGKRDEHLAYLKSELAKIGSVQVDANVGDSRESDPADDRQADDADDALVYLMAGASDFSTFDLDHPAQASSRRATYREL